MRKSALSHALLILSISYFVIGSDLGENAVGEPSDYLDSSENEPTNQAYFADSSVMGNEDQVAKPNGDVFEAEIAMNEDATELAAIQEFINDAVAELNQAYSTDAGETQVGRDAGKTEREKIMNLLHGVQDELDLAQNARELEIEKEYRTGVFGSSSRGRGGASGFTYSSKQRWEHGHGYTYRNTWKRPRGHKWAYGHGYENPRSVMYDMSKNSRRSSRRRSQKWHYGHGYEPKGTWNFKGGSRRSSRRSSRGKSGGGFFGRRQLLLLEDTE